MKLSMRYGLVGIFALGVLSLVHWSRKSQYDGPAAADFLIGVLPNLAAAIAIPFVLLSIWSEQRPVTTYRAARQTFFLLTLFAGLGLIAWEFVQRSSRTLVFDLYDMGATILGLGAGWLLFILLTPRGVAKKA